MEHDDKSQTHSRTTEQEQTNGHMDILVSMSSSAHLIQLGCVNEGETAVHPFIRVKPSERPETKE